MRQTIDRETLKTHFVPTAPTGGAMREAEAAQPPLPLVSRAGRAMRQRSHRPRLRGVVSTVFWGVVGEKAFGLAVTQRRLFGALFGGSLAAATAYAQEEEPRRSDNGPAHAAHPRRALLSFHAAMGLGLAVGALLLRAPRR